MSDKQQPLTTALTPSDAGRTPHPHESLWAQLVPLRPSTGAGRAGPWMCSVAGTEPGLPGPRVPSLHPSCRVLDILPGSYQFTPSPLAA